MNSKKTIPTVALVAILMISLTPISAFALSPGEERAQGRQNTYDPFAQSVATSSTFVPLQNIDVNTQLQILVDVSGSVNDTEFALQKGGYVEAFMSQGVIDIVEQGCPPDFEQKGIASQYIYWSAAGEQQVAVDWTHINDTASSNAYAIAINDTTRPFSDLTAPGSAINFGAPLFNGNNFTSTLKVMDLSGDGDENDGDDTATASNNAIAGGITNINGIVITNDTDVIDFYNDEVKNGPDGFVVVVGNFTAFADAVEDKIIGELCVCPPGTTGQFPECVEPPVGGESLSINTASLMVAGIYANALWILPVLAGVAGTGAYVIRSRMNKD